MSHGTRQPASWDWLAKEIVAQLVSGRKSVERFTDMLNQNCPAKPDPPSEPKGKRSRKYGKLS